MLKVATLGPAGTFTEIAAKEFIAKTGIKADIEFYTTIQKTFEAIGKECDLGVIPIENVIDGYVQRSLDLLLNTEYLIVNEVILPINFTFVSNVEDLEEIERVYVQFKTQGQCLNFLNKLDSEIITTASNGESYESIKNSSASEGAIIPSHIKIEESFKHVIPGVEDHRKNQTRFIIISRDRIDYRPELQHKTSLVIVDAADEPGILSKILTELAENSINLKSIMSRPTKEVMGSYHFYIDIDGNYYEDEKIKRVVDNIREKNEVKVLGSYSCIG